ncbi:MAG: hypothetical protein WCR33_03605 [Bacilli bacterium]
MEENALEKYQREQGLRLCPQCLCWVKGEHHCFKFTTECDYIEEKEIYAESFEQAAIMFAQDANECHDRYDENVFDKPIPITDENGVTRFFNCFMKETVTYTPKEYKEEDL